MTFTGTAAKLLAALSQAGLDEEIVSEIVEEFARLRGVERRYEELRGLLREAASGEQARMH